MVDEVQTGIGRTGAWFAYQGYGIDPDVITVAKGLGNGFPVGAMLAKAELKPFLGPGSHGTTFGGNPLAMAVANAVLQELEETSLLSEAEAKGKWLAQTLTEELAGLKEVVAIRSMGLMAGVELNRPVTPLIAALLNMGVVTLPAGEKVLRLLPPLVVTLEQIKEGVARIKQAICALDAPEAIPAP
jgi:acetylornithine aminotransferase